MTPLSAGKKVFEIARDGDIVIVTPAVNLGGILMEAIAGQVRSLVATMDDETARHVVVDLRHTTYFGSDFIAVLLKLWRRVRGRDGRFSLCHMSPTESEVLRVCELDKLWTICPTLEEALANVRQ